MAARVSCASTRSRLRRHTAASVRVHGRAKAASRTREGRVPDLASVRAHECAQVHTCGRLLACSSLIRVCARARLPASSSLGNLPPSSVEWLKRRAITRMKMKLGGHRPDLASEGLATSANSPTPRVRHVNHTSFGRLSKTQN
eukprot:4214279-Pleurochrysis_carterae.AAC.1